MIVVKEFQEDQSAKDFGHRPEFQELLKYARMHREKVDYLLVTDWDRFSRNIAESLSTIEQLEGLGIKVNSINSWTDSDDPHQFIAKIIHLALPESENRIKAQRVKKGMRQGLKEGRYNGKQPIGYISGRDHEGKVLMKPHPTKGPLITELFKSYATGNFSQNQLLHTEKYSALKLSKSNLSRILCNELYTGRIIIPEYGGETKTAIIGLHEPLISIQLFNKVQTVLGKRIRAKEKPSKYNLDLPLRGHLECPQCGRNLTGSASKSKTGKRHFYYHCNTRAGCNYRLQSARHHQAFDALLNDISPPKEIATLFRVILEDEFKSRNANIYGEVKKQSDKIKSLKENKRKLMDKLIVRGSVKRRLQNLFPSSGPKNKDRRRTCRAT